MCWVYPSKLNIMTILRYKILTKKNEVIKLKSRSLVRTLIQYDWCPGKTVHRRMQSVDSVNTLDKTAICKPWIKVSEETNPVNTLISDFHLPELWENIFLLLNAPICGTLLCNPGKIKQWQNKKVMLFWSFAILYNCGSTENGKMKERVHMGCGRW